MFQKPARYVLRNFSYSLAAHAGLPLRSVLGIRILIISPVQIGRAVTLITSKFHMLLERNVLKYFKTNLQDVLSFKEISESNLKTFLFSLSSPHSPPPHFFLVGQ